MGGFKIKDPLRYKTAYCVTWACGFCCPFGLQCQFAHGQEEKRERLMNVTPSRCLPVNKAIPRKKANAAKGKVTIAVNDRVCDAAGVKVLNGLNGLNGTIANARVGKGVVQSPFTIGFPTPLFGMPATSPPLPSGPPPDILPAWMRAEVF